MDDLFVLTESDFTKRPVRGYSYIYIYSIKNLYLYVGQTIQSLGGRFYNHKTDHSGAHYADRISYLQIRFEYANFAEGYLARRCGGICQGGVPNPEKYAVPDEVKREVQRIGDKLQSLRFTPPLFTFSLQNDGSKYEYLSLFHNLLCVEDLVWDNFITKSRYVNTSSPYSTSIYMGQFTLLKDEEVKMNHPFFILANKKQDLRPMAFFQMSSVSELLDLKPVTADFPIYCILPEKVYQRYKEHLVPFCRKHHIGLLAQKWSGIELICRYKEPFPAEPKNLHAKTIRGIFTESSYMAYASSYGYFQCA
jgi:hypothetical protein